MVPAVSKRSPTRRARRGHRGTHGFLAQKTHSMSFRRIHAPQKIFTYCCRASSPIELSKSAASLPRSRILAAIVMAGIVVGVVLQWHCHRRYAATGGDDEKDSSVAAAKENAPVTLGGSEDRHSGGVQGARCSWPWMTDSGWIWRSCSARRRTSLRRAAAASCTTSSPSTAPPSRCIGSASPTTATGRRVPPPRVRG
jgi:hypothetical protein